MPRKLVRRRIRREFPRILYFSEVYDSSYCRDPAEEGLKGGGRRMTGEVVRRSKLRCRQRGQVQVARSSSTPPTRKIYSFPYTTGDVRWPSFEKTKKKKKKKKERVLCQDCVLNEVATIYFRSRAFRTRWIAFRISLTSSTNSSRATSACVSADIGRKKWKIERAAGARSLMNKFFKRFFDWIFSVFFFFFFLFSFSWTIW